ncbi:MAG: polysaccharide biosynthesis protein, partial [Deltaproteobacteria bacterium CG17_big_fil_post_rev_8_21_14_2_50_51_6]
PILLMKSAAFIVFGLYKGMWRYTSVSDLSKLHQATVISTLGLTAIVLFVFRFQGFSRAVFLLDWGLTLIFTGGIRLLIRVTYARGLWGKGYNGIKSQNTDVLQTSEGKLAIIVGAGSAGDKLIRELKESRRLNYRIKALVDDDKDKIGRTIHGVPVLGSVEELPAIVKKCKASEIFIAMPSARGPSMRRIVKHCESCGIPYKTLPGMGELVEGRVSIKELR